MTDRLDDDDPRADGLEPYAPPQGSLEDLVSYIRDFGSATGQPAGHVVQSVCASCGGSQFWMQCSEEDGVASRSCTGCRTAAFIGDSADLWEQADVGDAACPCGQKVFEVAVGYCLGPEGGVDWMIVGGRCVACTTIGVYADWSIDYEPSIGLLQLS